MDVGKRLKEARMSKNMTQDNVAEKLGVSRQTISNWENCRSYPDILSVVELSNIYSVSLDELMKEDINMIEHLEESTNVVKRKKRFTRIIMLMTYLVIWTALVISYWVTNGAYFGMNIYLINLPLTTLIFSILLGKEDGSVLYKLLWIPFFGLMGIASETATIQLSYLVWFHHLDAPSMMYMLPCTISSLLGILVGIMIRKIIKIRELKKNNIGRSYVQTGLHYATDQGDGQDDH